MANGFGSLHVGASGIRGAQNGLNVIANNIANVDTQGYVRQQVVYEDNTYVKFGTDAAISKMAGGLGVNIGDVVHTRDMFLDQAYRSENGRQAFYEANYEAAMEVETLLKENGGTLGTSFGIAIEDLYTAFSEFSKEPAEEVKQNLIVQKADLFMSRAQAVYDGLISYQRNVNSKINDDIDRINELGQMIHQLNISIERVESGGIETAMDLRDARDVALDELAGLASISYYELPNGVVKVKLENTDFVIESRSYEIGKLEDPTTGFVTPYWEILSDPKRGDYYEVFDIYNVDPTKKTDIGELKSLLLARGDKVADYSAMLDMDYSSETLSLDKTMYPDGLFDSNGNMNSKLMMGSYTYNSTISNSLMINEETELDTLIHDLVTAINNLVSPITDFNDTEQYNQLTDGKDVSVPADPEIPLANNEIRFYDAENNVYLNANQVDGLIVFDEARACVGNDYDPQPDEDGQIRGMPPKELFSRVGCDRYRKVVYEYLDENGKKVEGTLFVYNEEGIPRHYNEDYEWINADGVPVRGGWIPDSSTCYTIKSLSLNQEVKDNPALIAHRHQNGDIAYDLGADIYALWESKDCYINPSDETACGFAEFYSKMVGELATTGQVYKTASDNLESSKMSIESNRQAVIGVSTDEELQTMIKFQNAFNASSRYMNVVSEMIQTLISSMGA